VADKDTSEADTPPCAEACHKEVPHNLLEEDTQPIPLPEEVDRPVGSNLPGHEPPEDISEDLLFLLALVDVLEGGPVGIDESVGQTHLLLQAEPHRCLSVHRLVLAFETNRYSSLFRAVFLQTSIAILLIGICNTLEQPLDRWNECNAGERCTQVKSVKRVSARVGRSKLLNLTQTSLESTKKSWW
jgi:hypothetical protein